jgi:hypothetical protein
LGVAGFGGGGGFGGAPEKDFFLGGGCGATEEEFMCVHPSSGLIFGSEWGGGGQRRGLGSLLGLGGSNMSKGGAPR